MKKILFLTALTVPMFGLTINFSKTFETEIKPDTLSANINIRVKKQSEKDVVEELGRFSTFVDNSSDIEKKGGNYSVYPEYRYENNHRYKDGYNGNISYQIHSKDNDKLNNFLTSLYGLKVGGDVDIATSSVSWMMSEEQKTGKVDVLRLKVIKWSNDYAKNLSADLSTECKVKSVFFSPMTHRYPQPEMMRANMAEDKAMAPTPRQDIQKISVTPNISVECK